MVNQFVVVFFFVDMESVMSQEKKPAKKRVKALCVKIKEQVTYVKPLLNYKLLLHNWVNVCLGLLS